MTDFPALSVVIPLVKIDEERRLIVARAAQEIPDKSSEIMDYATAKPQFQSWSQEFEKLSNGLSKGNVRVMHTRTVAGKLTDIGFDDEAKAVDIVMKISDANEWQKCLDGCYTGVSIGGGYLRKWKDPVSGMTRYTPIVREMSLVDNPCIPTARFAELVKADGMSVQLQLRGVARTFSDRWDGRPRTFGELDRARPRTFGELHKGIWGTIGSMALGAAGIADPELGVADMIGSAATRAGAAISDLGGAAASAIGSGFGAIGSASNAFADSAGPKIASLAGDGVSAVKAAASTFGPRVKAARTFASRLAAGSRAMAANPAMKTGLIGAGILSTGVDAASAGINLMNATKVPKPIIVHVPTPAMPSDNPPAAPAGMPRVPGLPRQPRIGMPRGIS